MSEIIDDQETAKKQFQFGDTSTFTGIRFIAKKNPNLDYPSNYGRVYTFDLKDPERITAQYTRRLRIDPISRDASILELSVTGTIPEKEIDFLNKLVEQYRKREINLKNENASKTIEFIDLELDRISDSLNLMQSEVERFKGQRGVSDINQRANNLYGQLSTIQGQLTNTQQGTTNFNSLIQNIRNNNDPELVMIPSTLGYSDDRLNSLVDGYVQKLREKKGLSSDNPFYPKVEQEVNALRANIIQVLNSIKGSSSQSVESLQARANNIRAQIGALPRAQREFLDITRLSDLNEGLYKYLQEKRAEAMVSKAATISDIEVVNPAMIAGAPISPQPKRSFLIAFFLGITLPLAFVLLKEYFSTRVVYKEDIEKLTKVPFLGQIWRNAKGNSNVIVEERPKSAVAESFRSVRSNLQFFTTDSKGSKRVFVVTSTISGEGKDILFYEFGGRFCLFRQRKHCS